MLDCGLSMQSILHFMPLPMVPSAKFNSLPTWLPRDNHQDWQIEGVGLINMFDIYIYIHTCICIYIYVCVFHTHNNKIYVISGIKRMLWKSIC